MFSEEVTRTCQTIANARCVNCNILQGSARVKGGHGDAVAGVVRIARQILTDDHLDRVGAGRRRRERNDEVDLGGMALERGFYRGSVEEDPVSGVQVAKAAAEIHFIVPL